MIRSVFRFFGLIALAAAFIFFVYDGVRFIANRKLDFTTVGYTWSSVQQSSLTGFQTAVEHRAGAKVWTALVEPYFLHQPIFLVLLVIGAILVLLGRPKRPLIGYSR